METRQAVHPSAGTLEAFGLGKLDDASAEAVISHLQDCPDCCQRVAAASGDDFINRLRQAHDPHATEPPSQSVSESTGIRQDKPTGPANPAVMTDLPAELASHSTYDIIRELGRGGMGVVYLAYNRVLARQEVLKVVSKTLIDQAGGKSRFLREMQSAAQLNHPNVVKAHTAVLDGERLLAFAMEYIDGEDLDKAVKARGRPLAVVNACYYIQQAAKGLQHAFEKGMVHRDIKPQNLIRSIEGKTHVVKVLDFGLAKLMREQPMRISGPTSTAWAARCITC